MWLIPTEMPVGKGRIVRLAGLLTKEQIAAARHRRWRARNPEKYKKGYTVQNAKRRAQKKLWVEKNRDRVRAKHRIAARRRRLLGRR